MIEFVDAEVFTPNTHLEQTYLWHPPQNRTWKRPDQDLDKTRKNSIIFIFELHWKFAVGQIQIFEMSEDFLIVVVRKCRLEHQGGPDVACHPVCNI